MQCMMKDHNNNICNNPIRICRTCAARGCRNPTCRNQNFDQSRCMKCGDGSGASF